MLNILKKKKTPEKAETESTATEKTESRKVEPAVFSARIAGVFSIMYRMIFSVDISNNIYQLELGEPEMQGTKFPVRGYFDTVFSSLLECCYPDERERLQNSFSRPAVSAAFNRGKTDIEGKFRFAGFDGGKTGDDATYSIYELRADRISYADAQPRMILYIKPSDLVAEDAAKNKNETPDFDSGVLTKLYMAAGNKDAIVFSYLPKRDIMHVRKNGKESVTAGYLASLDSRSDWTISHDDIRNVREILKSAQSGNRSEKVILYRKNGLNTADFANYRIIAFRGDENGSTVNGYLLPSDGDTGRFINEFETNSLGMMKDMFAAVYEINTDRDTISRIVFDEKGMRRSTSSESFSFKIKTELENGTIEPGSMPEYRMWVQKDYLLRRTLGNNSYEFDTKLKLPGSSEYRNYRETLITVDGHHRFFRYLRDVTDSYNSRRLEYEIEQQSKNNESNRYMLEVMASLVEFRNVESGAHVAHVSALTKILLEDIKDRSPVYNIDNAYVDLYSEAAIMHDIGKIAVGDAVLNKPGKLTEEEREIMRSHTVKGYEIIQRLKFTGQEKLKEACADVARHHHERWDGRGYPDGLAGEAIQIGVQAVSMADVFDALVSERCYKDSLDVGDAKKMIMNGECGAFNPRVLESMSACLNKMVAIYSLENGDKA